MTETLLVAVYGSLKRGFYNHRLLEESSYLADGQVQGFAMYSLGSFPMVIQGQGSIAVEVYRVDRSTMAQLDRLEGFPHFYGRQMVEVQSSHCPIQAWLYVGQPHQVKHKRRVRDGIWRQPRLELMS